MNFREISKRHIRWLYELVWLCITVIGLILVLSPIYLACGSAFSFYLYNVVFVVIFILGVRWIFFLKHSWFAHVRWVKLILIFLPIPIFFYASEGLFAFQQALDHTGLQDTIKELPPQKGLSILRYIKTEYIFFATSAIIILLLIPIRMIISIWRKINRGTV